MIGDRWGVTPAETGRRYPCDDIVASPALAAWRGVTVHAATGAVWPWVAQIRLAPYAYGWIDNRGRRSPSELIALPEPTAGEPFTTVGTRRVGRILSVSSGEQLTGRISGVVMSYLLVPDGGDTRLLLKIVTSRARRVAPLLSIGDLIMARRQLLNLKQLAEHSSPTTPAGSGDQGLPGPGI